MNGHSLCVACIVSSQEGVHTLRSTASSSDPYPNHQNDISAIKFFNLTEKFERLEGKLKDLWQDVNIHIYQWGASPKDRL